MKTLKIIIILLVVSLLTYLGAQLQNPTSLNVLASGIACLTIFMILAFLAPIKKQTDPVKVF